MNELSARIQLEKAIVDIFVNALEQAAYEEPEVGIFAVDLSNSTKLSFYLAECLAEDPAYLLDLLKFWHEYQQS